MKNFVTKNNNSSLPVFFAALLSLLIVSCEQPDSQPFKAGLGPMVDLQAPVIVLTSPGAGAFIHGETEFKGRASDDIKLESVWFQISNYKDKELSGYKKMDHELGVFYRITNTSGDSRRITWNFKIQTTLFDDGDFMLRLLAIDSVGKEAVTDEIAFYVKNNIPQISMAAPSIIRGESDGDLGGQRLNFGYINKQQGAFPRVMDTGVDMVGMISDNQGINRRAEKIEVVNDNGVTETVELFPPQIRFWQVNIGTPADSGYVIKQPGAIPSLAEVPWQKLKVMEIGPNNLQFTFTLPKVSGQYYGFEIRAQSEDKLHSTAEYPGSWVNYGGQSDEFIKENSYVLIYVREPLEYPVLELYGLEDIFGRNGWNENKKEYNKIPGVDPDGNHVYVDKPISRKNGPFTLRMKASHSGGIASAKVYWEKDDKSAKGRFIWDPANVPPFDGWKGGVVSGSLPYYAWGRADPNIGYTVRNYVFTYNDNSKDRIPDTPDFANNILHGNMRNKSKIQVYTGSDDKLDDKGKVTGKLDFDELPEEMANWGYLDKLEEGTYNISVYTTSTSGTRIATPYTATISIDRKPPDIELNYIEGSAGKAASGGHIVNGVIRPRFILSDSRSVDTGFRTGTVEYFRRDPESFYSEQAYILIPKKDQEAMTRYLDTNPWPQFPNKEGLPPTIKDVTISKHGVIFNASCLFKTSNNYSDKQKPLENDALDDGSYLLYAFARDNAFNVGKVIVPIEVKFASDDPAFNFSVGNVNTSVKEPDHTEDRPASTDGDSFIVITGVRNKFTSNSNIRVRISDDDSLDLGIDGNDTGDESKISVTIIGSTTVNGKTVAYDSKEYTDANPSDTNNYLKELPDADIKNAFAPQPVASGGERNPVKEILGTITQSMLLEALKTGNEYNSLFGGAGNKGGYSSLPDGIYRVNISISDYSPAKLVIETPATDNPGRGPDSPKVKTKTEYFWIAVDSKNPEFEFRNEVTDGDKGSKPANSYISETATVYFSGWVKDENGPITLEWRIYNEKFEVGTSKPPTISQPIMNIDSFKPLVSGDSGYDASVWKYNFEFPIQMRNNIGTYTFEVKFKDRFGNISTMSRSYSVDNEPPRIALTKPIETFSRNFDDVLTQIKNTETGTQTDKTDAGYKENSERLAVKTVSFSFSAQDNFKVSGVRWWLLPANIGADKSGFINMGQGQVTDYDAYPSSLFNPTPPNGGTYYSTTDSFTYGAYGVVNVEDRKFTIAVDSTKMSPANGEYRLHIIAIDAAGNVSRVTDDAAKKPTSNLFQTVFFLQDQDRPYLDANISPNVVPGGKTQVVGETGLVVRGTIWENNGFGEAFFWDKSIQVWFAADGNTAGTIDSNTTIVNSLDDPTQNPTISGYTGPVSISAGLGRSGRNLSLQFSLKEAFPTGFTNDGLKRYIIRAIDSPVNKLKEDADPVQNPAGLKAGFVLGTETTGTDEGLRVSRWKQYSFIYDGVPPEIKIETPDQGHTFGKTSFGTDFDLGGYIADANLADMTYYYQNLSSSHPNYDPSKYDANGNYKGPNDTRYYFEYYLDNELIMDVFPLTEYSDVIKDSANVNPTPTKPTSYPQKGKHIYYIHQYNNQGKITVYFHIEASDVAAARNIAIGTTTGIIPQTVFDGLSEGSHYLTLSARDLSGKETSAMYNFIKDTSPPTISFRSIVNDKDESQVADNWWSQLPPVRHNWLLAHQLSTIYYEPNSSQRPILSGAFGDDVSDIAVTPTGPDNMNSSYLPPNSTFRYWIDRDKPTMYPAVTDTTAKTAAFLDGSGRNVRWDIYLTEDGTKTGKPLPDGVHTIVIEVADTAGVRNPDGPGGKAPDYKVIAFRIDSKAPVAVIEDVTNKAGTKIANTVFGDAARQQDPVFILKGTAKDANLKDVWIRIQDKTTKLIVNGSDTDNNKPIDGKLIRIDATSNTVYVPLHSSPPALPSWESPSTPIPFTPDDVTLNWSYNVTQAMFGAFTDGRSYEVIVVARDQAGNESEQFLWTFTYDKSKPEITFPSNTSTPNVTANADLKPKDFIELTPADNPSLAEKNGINRLRSENLRIQGEVTDASSAIKKLESQVWKYNWDTGNWVIIETWTDIPGLDTASNNLLKLNWTKNLLGQDKELYPSLTRHFNLGDQNTWQPAVAITNPTTVSPEGLYKLQLRAKDASYTEMGTDNWAVNDRGNPAESYYVYFYYDRADPELNLKGEAIQSNFYSTSRRGGNFTFEGTMTDNNRFARLEVATGLVGFTTPKNTAVFNLEAATNVPPYTSLNIQPSPRDWKVDIPVDSTYTDGRYSVIVTVYDMTGRSYSVRKDFTLDNTPPGARFTLPAKTKKYAGNGIDSESGNFASEVVNGGEPSVITGETWDKPGAGAQNGSESGIDQMWFHLGFLDGVNNAVPQAPTRATIKAYEDALIKRYIQNVGTVPVDSDGNIIFESDGSIIPGPVNSNPTQSELDNMPTAVRNKYMDQISDLRADALTTHPVGNAWFKLGGKSRPTGFTVNPNIYDWRMEIPNRLAVIPSTDYDYQDYLKTKVNNVNIAGSGVTGAVVGGLKLYGGNIWVKGREYRVVNGKNNDANVDALDNYQRQMARAVPAANAGGQSGVYRLPLWIRLVDKVGNVQYYCHDIFFYPDGDIPTTSITLDNSRENQARGGAISVDGTARSNTAVFDVVFRVFADWERGTDLDGSLANPVRPVKDNVVRMPSSLYEFVRTDSATYQIIKANAIANIKDQNPGFTDAQALLEYNNSNYYNTEGLNSAPSVSSNWYRSNLMMKPGEPIIPWNFMINSDGEIRSLIITKGFNSTAASGRGTTPYNMIRVWVEVYVFNGETDPIRSSVYANDSKNTAGGSLYGASATPKPYVRSFYIQTAAPEITHPNVRSGLWLNNVWTWGQWNPENPTGTNIPGDYGYKGSGTEKRRGRFAVKAILDPNPSDAGNSGLGEVVFRTRLDNDNSGWSDPPIWAGKPAVNGAGALDPALPAKNNGVSIILRQRPVNNDPANRDPPTLGANRYRYNFEYAVDSTALSNSPDYAAIANGRLAYTGGILTVQIRIKDNATPPNEAQQTIEVGIDNFAPVADPNTTTNPKVAGTNVDFMGRAYDYATAASVDSMPPIAPLPNTAPRKVESVIAWFTKEVGGQTRYVNMNKNNTTAQNLPANTGTRTMYDVWENRSASVVEGPNDTISSITLTQGSLRNSVVYPGRAKNGDNYIEQPHNADWVRELSESTATPGTKMVWSPVNSSDADIRWSFNLDTTKLPDGTMTMHYLVVDEAGNASYYTQTISVRNKYPQIDRVTLYTDNNGIGAVYTTHNSNNIASTEYDLNDYRNKMFANYTDIADNQYYNGTILDTNQNNPNQASRRRSDSVGYLNSGFISKNQYIGFKVETSYGNRDLNFRLQYVTRERIKLTKTNLGNMVADRKLNDPEKINLYTIAWHGDYSNSKWRALGVPIDNPRLGTHFVLQLDEVPADYVDSTAEVWKYKQVMNVKRPDLTPGSQTADDAVVLGPENFDFNGSAYFNTTPANGISEFTGSQPDYRSGDKYQDDPRQTAFFLIRAWDTVDPPVPPATKNDEAWINQQLYDALVVGMNVYLNDKERPIVRLYDLNPYAETAVTGNNIGNATDPVFGGTIANSDLTIRNALNPRSIGENILRGGLYNTRTERELVKSGHIEPRTGFVPPTSPNAPYNGSALHPRVKNPASRVYETLTADGFVEGDSEVNSVTGYAPLNKDLVSGKVILRGSAWDDQLIREIRVNIGTGSTPPASLYDIDDKTNTILELVTAPSTDPNYLTMKPSFVSGASGPRKQAWAVEELHWKTGHTVEWAYVWDTEALPNANGDPAADIKVWVAVIDHLGKLKTGLANALGPASDDSVDGYAQITADNETEPVEAKRFKNTITVDIVPYITGIERDAKYATRRSLQGWYSFFQGEGNIAARGYNLGTSNAMNLYDGAANYNLTPSVTANAEYAASPYMNSKYRVNFSIPAAAKSGKIILNSSVSVSGSSEALNHRSSDKQSWNRESHAFTDGSDLWINKPYAHIWRTGDSAAAPRTYMGRKIVSTTSGSEGLNHPGMALEYNNGNGNNPGRLHGTWQVYGYANVYYGNNNDENINLVNATPTEPFATPDISIFNGGALFNNTANTVANIGFAYQGDGNAVLYVKAVAGATPIADWTNANAVNVIQSIGTGVPTQTWQNIRISKAAANSNTGEPNVGRIYMTAFNARYNNLWYGSRNNSNANTTMVIDGADGGPARISDTNNGLAPVASAGQFSAVDYDATGPIIAYYDQTNDTLRIALGLNATPGTGANQWNRKYVLPSGHPLYRGSGRYVSIKVDKDNRIHLAFFNSSMNTVVYAYAADRNANFQVYAVDDVVKGGTWTDISVDNNGNPWIVYGDSTRTGNYDGARMAYRSGTGNTTGIQFVRERKASISNTDATPVYITGWEAVSMPANYQVNNDRLNIEAWPPTDRRPGTNTLPTGPGWNAAIGYASDMFRIGYFYYPTYKDGNY